MLVLCEFLKLLVKRLTDDEKYCLLYRENFTQQIDMVVSQKGKLFSQFFSAFLKSILNFEHFQKKDDPHSRCGSQLAVSEKGD